MEAIILCLFLVLIGSALAQTRTTKSGPDPSIQVFWEEFKTTVIKGDKAAVANLSRFPIGMPYRKRVIRTSAELIQRYHEVFSPETDAAKCFSKAQPVNSYLTNPKQFTVGCTYPEGGELKAYPGEEPLLYTFTLTQNGWRLSRFDYIID